MHRPSLTTTYLYILSGFLFDKISFLFATSHFSSLALFQRGRLLKKARPFLSSAGNRCDTKEIIPVPRIALHTVRETTFYQHLPPVSLSQTS
ncbi:hypothetical protein V8F33_001836 [Rhypophila sp. PSN 637]